MENYWLSITAITFVILAQLSFGSSSDYWKSNCIGENYTVKSQYERNLKKAADMLARKLVSSPALFATDIVGTNREETVHALAQCRGDISKSACKRCITHGFNNAQLLCRFRKGAIVYRDLCTLGYNKDLLLFPTNFLTEIVSMKFDSSQVDIHSTMFDDAILNISKAVADTAIVSSRHFGTGQKEVNAIDYNLTIYALAQCLPSMSARECGDCLCHLIDALSVYTSTAGRASTLWCSYRFSLYCFFRGKPTLRLPAEIPHGNHTPPAAKQHKSQILIWVSVALSTVVVIGILILLLICWCKKTNSLLRRNQSPGENAKRIQLTGSRTDEGRVRGDHVPLNLRQVVCPSALDSLKDIIERAQGKIMTLFLDYDGTLAHIVNDPKAAFMSDEMREVLREVARVFPTSVVSGRERQQVVDFVKIEDINYAGSHGMDILIATKPSASEITEYNIFQPASEFLVLIEKVARSLADAVNAIEGAAVENNKFCATVHYRNVDQKYHLQVRNLVHEVLENDHEFHDLKLFEGHMHFDIRPPIHWDKGNAVKYLLGKLHQENSQVFAIHIGDDRTDEDAFTVLRDENIGIGIIVTEVERETSALYSLKNPDEVILFLKKLLKWRLDGYLED